MNQGTQTTINTLAVGGTETQVVRLDVGSGATAAEFGGTINRVTDLLKGTITSVGTLVGGGTLTNVGSLTNVGTVKGIDAITSIPAIGVRHADAFATVVSTGTNTFGTIKAAVAGSAIYITDLIISVGSATVVQIGDGTTDASNIIGSLSFAQYGGMVCNFNTPVMTSSGGTLVYKQSVGCPLTITALGYVD